MGAFDQTGGGANFDGFVSKLNSAGSSLVYSTYLGGTTAVDTVTSIALGTGGTAHVAGRTVSTNFPTTAGAFDTTFNGGANDAFAAKLNATGSALDYSTYLGGTGDELIANVAVDTAGSAYVGGATQSADYPSTAGAFDPFKDNGTDIFVTKLNSTGSAPVYSTFIGAGGSDIGHDIAVDANANVFVTGATTSPSFPVSPDAFDTSHNGGADVMRLPAEPAGSALTHSTFLGSSSTDTGRAIAVDSSANAFVTGDTSGATFPVTAGSRGHDSQRIGRRLRREGQHDAHGAARLRAPYGCLPLAGSARTGLCFLHVAQPRARPARPARRHQPRRLVRSAGDSVDPCHDRNPGLEREASQLSGVLPAEDADRERSDVRRRGRRRADGEITDVRNTTALTDYTGELSTELDLSITDRFNGPTHTETGTVQNIKFRVPLICTSTPGPQDIGSTCKANTTADAITPSFAREGVRSIWSLGQVLVNDGGADGDVDTTPNGVFVRQGILIP